MLGTEKGTLWHGPTTCSTSLHLERRGQESTFGLPEPGFSAWKSELWGHCVKGRMCLPGAGYMLEKLERDQ